MLVFYVQENPTAAVSQLMRIFRGVKIENVSIVQCVIPAATSDDKVEKLLSNIYVHHHENIEEYHRMKKQIAKDDKIRKYEEEEKRRRQRANGMIFNSELISLVLLFQNGLYIRPALLPMTALTVRKSKGAPSEKGMVVWF